MPRGSTTSREQAGQALLVAAQRDPRAFDAFYAAYRKRIVVFLTRRTFQPEVALDLTAEVFATAYAKRGQFRGASAPEEQAWLYRIARTQLRRFVERGEAERRAVLRAGITPPGLDQADIERIEELAGLDETRGRVAATLEQLPSEQRVAVQGRIVDERSYAELAVEFGVAQQVVRKRVSRGLEALREAAQLDPEDVVA